MSIVVAVRVRPMHVNGVGTDINPSQSESDNVVQVVSAGTVMVTHNLHSPSVWGGGTQAAVPAQTSRTNSATRFSRTSSASSAATSGALSRQSRSTAVSAGVPGRTTTMQFTFDFCFSSEPQDAQFASQHQIYDKLGAQILDSALKGFNACILAYGQTGSGKTYSMLGPGWDAIMENWSPQRKRDVKLKSKLIHSLDKSDTDKGLLLRICASLFDRVEESVQHAWELAPVAACSRSASPEASPQSRSSSCARQSFAMEVSYYQIYKEKVWCLLNPTEQSLRVREHDIIGPYVEDLTKTTVHSYAEVLKLLEVGTKSRKVAATMHNMHSSRSHAVFVLRVTSTGTTTDGTKHSRSSVINLVDLAGSERLGSAAISHDRLAETADINTSLSVLGKVIHILSGTRRGASGTAQPPHVPYRDSVLTWLLRECFGGNSKTIMLSTVSPDARDVEETLSTLRYSSKARKIVNRPIVNEDTTSKNYMAMKLEIAQLREYMMTSSHANVLDVQDRLAQAEKLVHEMRSREELIEERNKEQTARIASLEQTVRESAHTNQALQTKLEKLQQDCSKFFSVVASAAAERSPLVLPPRPITETPKTGRPSLLRGPCPTPAVSLKMFPYQDDEEETSTSESSTCSDSEEENTASGKEVPAANAALHRVPTQPYTKEQAAVRPIINNGRLTSQPRASSASANAMLHEYRIMQREIEMRRDEERKSGAAVRDIPVGMVGTPRLELPLAPPPTTPVHIPVLQPAPVNRLIPKLNLAGVVHSGDTAGCTAENDARQVNPSQSRGRTGERLVSHVDPCHANEPVLKPALRSSSQAQRQNNECRASATRSSSTKQVRIIEKPTKIDEVADGREPHAGMTTYRCVPPKIPVTRQKNSVSVEICVPPQCMPPPQLASTPRNNARQPQVSSAEKCMSRIEERYLQTLKAFDA